MGSRRARWIFLHTRPDIRNREKAKKHKWFRAGITGHMFFARRDDNDISRFQRIFSGVGTRGSLSRQDIYAFFAIAMPVHAAR
jgi:hypothetical protein